MRGEGSGVTFLDCTLRDGGFYTDWDFSDEFVHAYVHAMEGAGVDVAELGYRSLHHGRYVGALGYTPDWYVARLPQVERLRFAAMVDAKEFAGQEARVEELFSRKERSRISIVRVASSYANLDSALLLVERLRDLGYMTTVNLMAVATLPEEQRADSFRRLDRSAVDVVYFADSFGSMYPADVARCAGILKESTDKPWGVHLHNNLELAFSNALEAARVGATWIDTSVTGMGRGPGNLRTELFLQHCTGMHDGKDVAPVYDFIGRHVQRLHDAHRWGPGPAYILSGFLGVHPSYGQRLLTAGRYSVSEVTRILDSVHATGSGAHFDEAVLARAISNRHAGQSVPKRLRALPRPTSQTCAWRDRPVLIVGRGPSAEAQCVAVNTYIRRFDPIVIECNHSRKVCTSSSHFCAFVVSANARAMALEAAALGKSVLVASGTFLQGVEVPSAFAEEYDVRQGELLLSAGEGEHMVLPSDVVSMMAIAVAARCGARTIEVVGFDGYGGCQNERDRRMQDEMEEFLRLLHLQAPELSLTSLTRTTFSIPESSIYARLVDV